MSEWERQQLRFYLRARGRGLTVARLALLNWRHYAGLFVLTAFALVCFSFGGKTGDWLSVGLGGMVTGFVLRDIGLFNRSVHIWPLMERIIDWEEVGRLMEGDADAPTDGPPEPAEW